MGSWFSNLQIRKTEGITKESVSSCIRDTLSKQNCAQVECAGDTDFAVIVYFAQNSNWISVCSQALAHDDPESCKNIAMPLSSVLHTDVMGIACFDSDYLYMNLINADEGVDAWLGIGAGKELGITRRNNVTAWKKKVADYSAFSAAAKGTYVCADEFLTVVDRCLKLPAEQGSLSLDNLKDTALQQDLITLYFRNAEGNDGSAPNILIYGMRYAVPCFDGKENTVSFLNTGDAFCGLSVCFVGSFVEHDEISFSDVTLGDSRESFRKLELKKIQLSDGQWAYYSHIPDIIMPPGIRERMKPEKRHLLERERIRKISFVPHGNPRKMLDVTVRIIPDGKHDHQAEWNIWHQHGSKEAYIQWHNNIWKKVRAFETDSNQLLPLLKLEDFDE